MSFLHPHQACHQLSLGCLCDPLSLHLPPEVLALKSQKWIQMQKKCYGQKRKGGYIDMGKQVCSTDLCFFQLLSGMLYRICLLNMYANYKGPWGYV